MPAMGAPETMRIGTGGNGVLTANQIILTKKRLVPHDFIEVVEITAGGF
jgi:hypothetical protein